MILKMVSMHDFMKIISKIIHLENDLIFNERMNELLIFEMRIF